MALVVNPLVIDNGLSTLQGVTAITLCSAVPTTYNDATVGFALGRGDASFGAPQPATPKGRRSISSPISDGVTTGNGTAVAWAAINETTSTLLANSTLASPMPVLAGRVFLLGAITITLLGEQGGGAIFAVAASPLTVGAPLTPVIGLHIGAPSTANLTATPLAGGAAVLPTPLLNPPPPPAGIVRYVDTRSWGTKQFPAAFSKADYVGPDGTTPALLGPHAAYPSLKAAGISEQGGLGTPPRNLTGTGGLTFLCAGGDDRCYVPDAGPFNAAVGGLQFHPDGTTPIGYSRPVFVYSTEWVTTAADPIRIMGNPDDVTGRNFGPTFDTGKYYLSLRGTGVEGEPWGGAIFYGDLGHVIYDGIQLLVEATGPWNGPTGFQLFADHPVTVRNCRFLAIADNNVTRGGFGGGPGGWGISCINMKAGNYDLIVENCTFLCQYPYWAEAAVEITTAQGTCTVTNCTIGGLPVGVYAYAENMVAVKVTNTAIFWAPPGIASGVENFWIGGGGMVINNCASDDGDGISSIHWTTGAAAYNANFNNYLTGDFTLKAGAQLVNAGTAVGATLTDVAGTTRGSPPNIGAWENI